MSKKSILLAEENTKIYNKWVSGIAKKEAPSEVITVDDIVNRFRNNSNYNAPKILPFPLSSLLDFLGNIFIKTAELRHLLGKAVTYPLFKDNKDKINSIKSLNEKLKQIQEIIYSCAEDLNNLVDKDEE
jgi:hypothetical protein